jgi:hypothetical protein
MKPPGVYFYGLDGALTLLLIRIAPGAFSQQVRGVYDIAMKCRLPRVFKELNDGPRKFSLICQLSVLRQIEFNEYNYIILDSWSQCLRFNRTAGWFSPDCSLY